jgi:hypothetical protein
MTHIQQITFLVDNTRLSSSKSPVVNGLSDHNAKSPTVTSIAVATDTVPSKHRSKEAHNETIMKFQVKLKI